MVADVNKQWCVKRASSLTPLKQEWKPFFPRSITHKPFRPLKRKHSLTKTKGVLQLNLCWSKRGENQGPPMFCRNASTLFQFWGAVRASEMGSRCKHRTRFSADRIPQQSRYSRPEKSPMHYAQAKINKTCGNSNPGAARFENTHEADQWAQCMFL